MRDLKNLSAIFILSLFCMVLLGQSPCLFFDARADIPPLPLLPFDSQNALVIKGGVPLSVSLALPSNHQLNLKAPNHIALFKDQKGEGSGTLVEELKSAAMTSDRGIALKALNTETSYRLQATVFYCEDLKIKGLTSGSKSTCKMSKKTVHFKTDAGNDPSAGRVIQIQF